MTKPTISANATLYKCIHLKCVATQQTKKSDRMRVTTMILIPYVLVQVTMQLIEITLSSLPMTVQLQESFFIMPYLSFTGPQSRERTKHVWKKPDKKIQIIGKHITEEITLRSCAAGKNETTFKTVCYLQKCRAGEEQSTHGRHQTRSRL